MINGILNGASPRNKVVASACLLSATSSSAPFLGLVTYRAINEAQGISRDNSRHHEQAAAPG